MAGGVPAELGRAENAPADSIAGAVEAAERPLEALDAGQKRIFANLDILHHDLAGDRGPQGELAADFRRGEALHALFKDKALDLAAMRFGFGPNDEHIRDRRVRDPHFRAVQHITARRFLGGGLHAARIRAGIRLGQTETADQGAGGKAGEVFALLRLGAIGVDGIHHERGLHRHHRAVARIDPLDLAGDKAIGDIARAKAAEFLGYVHTQKPSLAHLAEDRGIGFLVTVGGDDARLELVLRESLGRIAQHPFVFGQLVLKAQGVGPVEGAEIGFVVCHDEISSEFGPLYARRLAGANEME